MFGQKESKIHNELVQSVKMLKSLDEFFNDALSGNLNIHKILAAKTGVEMTVQHLQKLIKISEQIHQMIEKEYNII